MPEKKGEIIDTVIETTLRNERMGLRTYGDGEDHDHEPPVRHISSQAYSKNP